MAGGRRCLCLMLCIALAIGLRVPPRPSLQRLHYCSPQRQRGRCRVVLAAELLPTEDAVEEVRSALMARELPYEVLRSGYDRDTLTNIAG